ncbi:MAG: bifunctional pyr operon transcriptional regulator/uracil phosphoribosyltransferase PyrR [Lachnospiraceae bacterium]|nr:bifunctional pyr operon transcriptional regulator/uracil phosphoribosyltransferase PyrR [Lachnospiraceae bacterium]
MERFKAALMDEAAVMRALKRIAHEIVERNNGAENLCIVGIKRRGIPLAHLIARGVEEIEGTSVPVGALDITFYRDDLQRKSENPEIRQADLGFSIEGKDVILVDDVLYTGRTASAALDALKENGRASSVQLAVLVDRGHRELPIRGDYVGKNVPTSRAEVISVKIPPYDEAISVELLEIET